MLVQTGTKGEKPPPKPAQPDGMNTSNPNDINPNDVNPNGRVCPACASASPTDACPTCGRTSGANGRPAATRMTGRTLNLGAATRISATAPAGTPELPPKLAERFETLGVLGRGGAGIVLRARDRLVGREVAIKVLGEAFQAQSRMLQGEATHLASLEHDRVVRLYEFGLAGDLGYLVMEFVRGETLWQRLARGRPALLEGLAIGMDLCEGLIAAHARGLVHSDIKPLNLFLDQGGRVKIADFGLARQITAAETQAFVGAPLITGDLHASPTQSGGMVGAKGPVLGTPGYMAPEQAEGRQPTPASDVYAAGVVIHEVLTGQRMFTGRTPLALMVEQQRGPRHRVADLNPGVPAGLDEVIMRCLATDPAQRPAADELGRELTAWHERLRRASRTPRAAGFPSHPYKFLDHFEAEDAVIYFGRESEIAELAGILGTESVRMAMVFGPCGVGKSSLLRAGMRKALDPETYDVTTLISGADPAEAIADMLKARAARTGELIGLGPDDPDTAPARVTAALRTIARNTGRTPVVVVDQLEELFTLNSGASNAPARFFELVCALVERGDVPLKLVLSFRTEFRGELFELERRLARHTQQYSVGEMGEPALVEAIEGPSWIESYGFGYEPGFARRLARDILSTVQERGDSAPPVLQIVCRQLFDHAKKEGARTIGVALYERALGGAQGALRRYVEDRLDGPGYGKQAVLARQMLRALTVRGEGGERFARAREESDTLDFPDRAAAKRVLEQLLADRLVVRESKSGGVMYVRLASEVICPLVEAWGPEVDEAERAARLLARTARQWVEHGRRDEDLLSGGGLELVERAYGSLREQDPVETELFRASRSARRARRLRVGFGGGLVAIFAAVICWVTFLRPGFVTLTSDPAGAEVFRDGESLGVTPVTFSSRPGTHQLTLKKERYGDAALTVRVPAGGEVSYAPVLPYPFGLLAISSNPPGARCEVRPLDSTGPSQVVSATTPFHQELPAGRYALTLSAHGYLDKRVDEITVPPNHVLEEQVVALEKNVGWLQVNCPFPGSQLTVRDKEGRAQWQATLPAPARELPCGTYALEAGGPGLRRETRSVEITRFTTTVCTAWTPPVKRIANLGRERSFTPVTTVDLAGDGRQEVLGVVDNTRIVVRSPLKPEPVVDIPLALPAGEQATIGYVKVGDVTGDGKPDAVAVVHPDSVVVFDCAARAQVYGIDGLAMSYGLPPALGDLDGDKVQEIVIAREGGGLQAHSAAKKKLLWEVPGNGQVKSAFEISGLAVADLDGDGRAEVLAFHANDTLRVHSGVDGSLLWEHTFTPRTKGLRFSIAAVSLAGGRGRELICSDGATALALDAKGKVLWTTTLEGPPFYLDESTFSDLSSGLLTAGDADGDGKPDAVLYGNGTIVALRGTDGKQLWRVDDAAERTTALEADFDGDGVPELAFQRDDQQVEVRSLKDGRLAWTAKSTELRGAPLVAVDWDGDGIADLMHLDEGSNVVVDGGAFVKVDFAFRTAGPAIVSPGVADLDGDGTLDVVTFSRVEGRAIVQAISGKDGRQLWSSTRTVPNSCKAALADLNGDGAFDVVAPAERGVVALNGKNGKVLWSGASSFEYVNGISFAKIDDDAILDVIVAGQTESRTGRREYTALSGRTGRTLWTTIPHAGVAAHAPVLLDADGDGLPEFVAGMDQTIENGIVARKRIGRRPTPGAAKAAESGGSAKSHAHPLILGAAPAPPAPSAAPSPSPSASAEPISEEEEANDGWIDIGLVSTVTGVWQRLGKCYAPAGNTTFQAADFDGDGKKDILAISDYGPLFTYSTRTSSLLWEVETDPAGNYYTPPAMSQATIYDVDGDGRADVVIASSGHLLCLSGLDGKPLWNQTLPESPMLPAAIWSSAPGTADLFTVMRDGAVLVADAKTGARKGFLRIKTALVGPPIIFDPRARVPTTEDSLLVPEGKLAAVPGAKAALMLDLQTLLVGNLADLMPRK